MQIKSRQGAYEKALNAFTEAVDKLDEDLTEEEEKKIIEHIEGAEETISEAENVLLRIQINKQRLNLTGGKLDKKDLQFIQKRRIRMSLPAESRLCSPTVLIGCDQLWNFIKFEAPQLSLPSGLVLVPTRFGYMISGRRLQQSEQRTDSRSSSVNVIESAADLESWEEHWNVGIHDIRSDDNSATSQEQTLDDQQTKKPTEPFRRYNLRTRKATVQLTRNSTSDSTTHTRSTRTWPLSLYLKMALTLILINTVNGQAKNDQMFKDIDRHETNYSIECNPKGVYFHAPEIQEYELCVKSYCMNGKTPPVHQLLRLPPEELLYDYEANWKFKSGNKYFALETKCPAQSYCASIDCTICSANILNPECWPLAAIFGLGASLYAIIALCYMICYVPVTIGHPLRIILRGACKILSTSAWCILTCIRYFMLHVLRKDQRHRSSRVLQALAVVCLIQDACSCQLVNIFSHHLQNCRVKAERTVCDMEVASVIKINPFKQETCLKFRRNDSDIWDVRLSWKGLNLHCNQESLLYTRKVEQKVIDSKRCPHMGSCIGNKCADVSASSLLPELAVGNSYPGITGCMESCGGPGCDCFYLSSGCLFYRIYAVPKDDEVYEIFRCITWKEIVKLRLDRTDVRSKKLRSYVFSAHPNVPQHVHNMDVTVSLISVPPLPVLEQFFISSQNRTAIWDRQQEPILRCQSEREAEMLQCVMGSDCDCTAAESQVICRCKEDPVESSFHNISNVLPMNYQQCSLKCGTTTNHFEITGILKYVHGFQGGIMQYVDQNHNNTSEFHWPDISHILDIYLQWYKTLVITIAAVAVAVLLSYVYLTTACGRFFRVCIYILTRIFACAWRMFTCVACLSFKHVGALFTKRRITKADVKLL
ncbi:unnamed protein product [Heligmosomoides polygyrus]|uniref:Phlebovirus_G2 domain-containing protein n=1 Tax=Heligmosomoides polygyrus TaxID=6339 RepID=A0A183GR17_HELPZ|nr:unnamed protein product [Heligmosomoides polygyrus]